MWNTAFLCAAVLLSSGVASADDVSMTLQDLGHGTYRLEGQFQVDAPRMKVWGVLTDYDHIDEFVSSLRKSEVKEHRENQILLEQEAAGRALIFSRKVRVLLNVIEEPYTRVTFEDTAKKDFVFYKGSWEIGDRAPGVQVVYRLDCQRRFKAPNFVARSVLGKNVKSLLSEVRAEILRRQKGNPP